MAETLQRYYVPQLDGLRFFAFLLVFFHHFIPSQPIFGEYPLLGLLLAKVQEFGWAGVDLFLVLSAFLITNLLLLEYRRTGTISLRDFYVRRSLRIWPLYYLMVLVGFFVSPLLSGKYSGVEHQQMMADHFQPYMVFLGNFSAGIHNYAGSRFLSHLWTISLEEQFYLVWPILLVTLIGRRKALVAVLSGLLVMSVALRLYWLHGHVGHPFIWTNLFCRLDPLVLGTLLAIYREGRQGNGDGDVFRYGAGLLLLVVPGFFPAIETHSLHIVWQYLSIAVGFCLILDASLAGKVTWPHLILTNRSIVWLGKLCYGLYVYHLVGINFAKRLQKHLPFWDGGELSWLATFSLGLLFTIILAQLSYSLYEKKFLLLKKKFTIIQSRPA
jgi:peptidoglycan/LPS O-acetylase OafA/YrhL